MKDWYDLDKKLILPIYVFWKVRKNILNFRAPPFRFKSVNKQKIKTNISEDFEEIGVFNIKRCIKFQEQR